MAKKGKKPTSKAKAKATTAKAKVKKVEPIVKDEAVEIKKAIPEKEKTSEVEKEVKKTKPKDKSYTFPVCNHKETKRVLGARNRVMHVCQSCGKIVKIGGR